MSHAGTETYKELKRKGKVKSQKEIIKDYIQVKSGILSIDACQALGMQWPDFCAYTSMLVAEGIVYYKGEAKFFDKTYSKIHYEFNPEQRARRVKEVNYGKYLKTIKRLKRDFEEFLPIDVVIFIDTELA